MPGDHPAGHTGFWSIRRGLPQSTRRRAGLRQVEVVNPVEEQKQPPDPHRDRKKLVRAVLWCVGGLARLVDLVLR